ncbi:MAG: hypothetical protein JWO73_871 [Candidatus Taylorbacteria bacterium]|nr:hypothetical protein [Candidatus Taylorbacteria bacterium]
MKIIIQKFIAAALILAIVLSSVGLTAPKKASAIFGVGDIVTDIGNTIEGTISAIADVATDISDYMLQYKETVLDGLAYIIAKQILRQLTASIVSWINTGFQGSPSFVTDPAGFFADVGDQITGDFIAHSGLLSQLCGNFSINLKLALAFKYRPYSQKRYACTLSSIVKSASNSISSGNFISVNGFTAGDFKQGKWPAFVSLTTEPQNNAFGAYLSAEDDLSYQIGTQKAEQKDELNQGHGFLSWQSCKTVPAEGDKNFVGPVAPKSIDEEYENAGSVNAPTSKKVCETQTPGSVIFGRADAALSSPGHELELADEFNEIISALFAQLVTTVLSKGLGAASGRGPSDTNSYLNQLQKEQTNFDGAQLEEIRTRTINNVEKYVKDAESVAASKFRVMNIALGVKKAYDAAKACYQDQIDSILQTPATLDASSTIAQLQIKIDSISSIIETKVVPIIVQKTEAYNTAQGAVDSLNKIKTDAKNAKTAVEISAPATAMANLLQMRTLPTARDIVNSEQEITTLQDQVKPLNDEAAALLQQCESTRPSRHEHGSTTQ